MSKLNRLLTWPVCLLVLWTGLALAQATASIPSPDTDAAAWAKLLYAAFTQHSWSVLTGLALIGIVYPLRRFGPDVLKTPFGGLVLAFLISLAGTLGGAMAVGVHVSLAMVASALGTAATAAGVWEWLKAHIPGIQAAADKSSAASPTKAAA